MVCGYVYSVAKSYPTLYDPLDCSLLGFSVHGISQARILEWVAVSSSRESFLAQGLNLCLLHCRLILYHWATWETKWYAAAAAAKWLQSCLTLCDPIDSSLPGSTVSGILQARTLEWVAISFSNAWKWKVKVKLLSHVGLSDPMDCSLQGSSIPGIFQARVLEWVAIAFSEMVWLCHNLFTQFIIIFTQLLLLLFIQSAAEEISICQGFWYENHCYNSPVLLSGFLSHWLHYLDWKLKLASGWQRALLPLGGLALWFLECWPLSRRAHLWLFFGGPEPMAFSFVIGTSPHTDSTTRAGQVGTCGCLGRLVIWCSGQINNMGLF